MKKQTKVKVGDIIEMGLTKWKVVRVYKTDNPKLFYKDRITMINIETGEELDCANTF